MNNGVNVEKFVSFIGPTRTGHSLVASLLSVHSEIAISLGLNTLFRYQRKMTKEDLFKMIFTYCEHDKERKKGNYHYYIENSPQGNIENIKIIGDSASTQKNATALADDKLFKELCNYVGLPIYWFWVIRNPFDNIHSGHLISGNSINHVIELCIERMRMTHNFRKKHKDKVFVLYIEDLIDNNKLWLSKMLEFLGMSCDESYLGTCSDFIFTKPRKVFKEEEWTDEEIQKVRDIITTIPELKYYE